MIIKTGFLETSIPVFAILFALSGCESTVKTTSGTAASPGVTRYSPLEPACSSAVTALPEKFDIYLDISNYKIRYDRIPGSISPINSIRVNGLFSTNDSVYARLDINYPGKCKSDKRFYMVDLPYIKDGTYTRTARIMYDVDSDLRNLPSPPEEIAINVDIAGGIVASHRIENYSVSTYNLYVKEIAEVYGKKVAIIGSRFYPVEEWVAELPESEGVYKIYARRAHSKVG